MLSSAITDYILKRDFLQNRCSRKDLPVRSLKRTQSLDARRGSEELREKYRTHLKRERHASAERTVDQFIKLFYKMSTNGDYPHNGSTHLPTGFRMTSSVSKDFLQPGSDVVVTRTVSPSFYQHGDSVFRKDDVVRITAPTNDPAWFHARKSNHEEGFVHVDCVRTNSFPSDIVRIRASATPSLGEHQTTSSASSTTSSNNFHSQTASNQPWFHHMITREVTEKLLSGKADGTFLIRESTNFPGDYTLSMTHRGKIEHYRIYQAQNNELTCDNEEFFSNLTQLVSHYKRDADGLCHRLITPVISDTYASARAVPNGFHTGDGHHDSVEARTAVFKKAGLVIMSSDVRLGDIIGHGEFGDVRIGILNDKKVAVKVSKRHGNGMLDSLLDEAKFMVGLSHQNLVTLVGVVLDDVNVYMITEYMANGNLVDLLRSRGRHSLNRAELIQFSIDICHGMCYLQRQQIVHRDLAARNVLLDDNLVAKISDFGLAKRADAQGNDTASGKFPIKWTAPEALRHSQFTTKSDVWSFGVLLWEIFSFGRVPYPRIGTDGRSPIQDVVRHIERGYRMEAPEGCPSEVVRLMNDTWALNPSNRPYFNQILDTLLGIQRSQNV